MTKREEVIAAMESRVAYIISTAELMAADSIAKEVWLETNEVLEMWRTR